MRSFEPQKYAHDVQAHRDEVRLRGQEIRLKLVELRQQRATRFTTMAVALVAAISAFIGGAVVAVIQGKNNKEIEEIKLRGTISLEEQKSRQNYDLEKSKAEQGYSLEDKKLASTLIVKAGETKDILEVVARLRFWIKLELIPKRLEATLDQELNQDPMLLFAARDASLVPVTTLPLPSGGKPTDTDEMKSYRRRIQERPGDTDALIYLGFALYKQGRLAEALEPLRTAVKINPNSQWGQYNLALIEFANSNTQKGESALKILIQQAPQFALIIRKHKQFDRFSEKSEYLGNLLREPPK
jgi:tetratricopeptide (TPR) repeat protein